MNENTLLAPVYPMPTGYASPRIPCERVLSPEDARLLQKHKDQAEEILRQRYGHIGRQKLHTVHRQEFTPRAFASEPTASELRAHLMLCKTEAQVLREERQILRNTLDGLRPLLNVAALDDPSWLPALERLDAALRVTG